MRAAAASVIIVWLAVVADGAGSSSSVSAACPIECICLPDGEQATENEPPYLKVHCQWPHIPGANLFATFPHSRVSRLSIHCKNTFPRSRFAAGMFGSFGALRHLTIRDCHSEDGRLPSGFTQGLNRLKSLHLERISTPGLKLQVEQGAFAGAAATLEKLTLSASNLAVLPPTLFCPIRELKLLNLSYNDLGDLEQIGFDGCENQLVVLDLRNNHLTRLRARSMQSLHILRLENNRIESIDKDALDDLPRLYELHLAGNNISRVQQLPTSIQVVDLADNRLATVPAAVIEHGNLVYLNLSGNLLENVSFAAASPAGASPLTTLDISRNRLRGIHAQLLANASNLQQLYLSDNRIESCEKDSFRTAGKLQHLDLGGNLLSALEKAHLAGVQNLSELILSRNRIVSISDDAFAATPQLRQLSLASNLLTEAPAAVTLLYYLQRLDLSDNSIDAVPKFLFDKLPNLKQLHLRGNKLTRIERYVLENLAALISLDLSANSIQQLDANCFDGTAAVKELRLDDNRIQDIHGSLVGLAQLQLLNLSANQINYIDFAMLPLGLRRLYASRNSISRLGNVLEQRRPTQLILLDLSHNRIKRLSANMLPNNIELANFSHNVIAEVDEKTLLEKINLTALDLSHNLIEQLPLNAVVARTNPAQIAHRTLLTISGNPLGCSCMNEWMRFPAVNGQLRTVPDQAAPFISDQSALQCVVPWTGETTRLLDLDSSQFLCSYKVLCQNDCVCCDFDSCDCKSVCPEGCQCYRDADGKINSVRCQQNFDVVSANVRKRIPMHASQIDISGNRIDELQTGTFFARIKLKQLQLNNTALSQIANNAFHTLTSLETLDLSHNLLELLTGREFHNVPQLRRLLLNDNHIQDLQPGLFDKLPNLRDITLHNNRLVFLPDALVAFAVNLNTLTLGGNPWKCDCDIKRYTFQRWLPENTVLVRDYQVVYCAENVDNVTNTSLATSIAGLPTPAAGQTMVKVNFWAFSNGINVTFCRPPSASSNVATPEILDATSVNVNTSDLGLFDGRGNLMLIVGGAAVGCIFVLLALALIAWHFRDRLRCKYAKYATTTGSVNSSRTTATTPVPLLQYDAFVSYSSEDQAFVVCNIANRLEQEYPYYNMCLLYRDLPTSCCADGHRIDDKIILNMERSQRVITVLTRSFLEREWTSTQLRTAYQYLMREKQRKPIVIIVDDLPEELDPTLAHYLRMNRCLYWHDPMFWQKLLESMPERSVLQDSATLNGSSHYSDIYGTIVPSRFI